MELATAFELLGTGTKSVVALRKFVQDELYNFLDIVGDIHFRAARYAIADAYRDGGLAPPSDKMPKPIGHEIRLSEQYLTEAIGHLRAASTTYIATREHLTKSTWAGTLREIWHGGVDRPGIERAVASAEKWLIATSTTAVLQKYLGQEKLVANTTHLLKFFFYSLYLFEFSQLYWYQLGKPPRRTQSQRDRLLALYKDGKPGRQEEAFRQFLLNLGTKPWSEGDWSIGAGPEMKEFPTFWLSEWWDDLASG